MSESATARQALETLAVVHGIAPSFEDTWGHRHEVGDAALRALLGQVGVTADSDAVLGDAMAREEVQRWSRLAEPVVAVSVPTGGLSVAVRVPRLAGKVGLAWRFLPEDGAPQSGETGLDTLPLLEQAEIDGLHHESRRLELELGCAPGYHWLELRAADREARVRVIAAPPRCYEPPFLAAGARVWGIAAQLYGLRSARNWGIGDFGDLLALVDIAAARGASAIGLNPLHARFANDPQRTSPYAPSSRLWLDVLAIDVEAVEDFAENEALRRHLRSPALRERLQALRDSPLVDHTAVSQLKHEAFGELYRHFRREHLDRKTPRAAAFRRFQAAGGDALRRHALYEVLQRQLHDEDPAIWGWPVWPEPWRSADAEALQRFAADRLEDVEYHEYLQWLADAQLAAAAARCRDRGMAIGLYLDLAVSVDRSGSDCWSFSRCYASSASVGAPPDEFNPMGQDWGLPPLIPEALRACAHAPFVLALRANMRHAGALRIDHVMGLMRLYWVPPAASPRDGGYIGYPADELLAIVRLESHRNRCLVVGEDLGTVPDEIRATLADAGVLSYRLLYFERDENGDFVAPQAYPGDALVSVSTHDLPTLAGWWSGHDLRLRERLGLFPDAAMQQAQLAGRAQDRERLAEALRREGLLESGVVAGAPGGLPTPMLVDAVHAWLARTPAKLMMVQPEDWLGVVDQSNVPGTVDEHPNWRRKLPLTLEALAGGSAAGAQAAVAPGAGAPATGERLAAVLAASGRVCAQQARIPLSTCRLQLNRDFGFEQALAALPYLARLGIGDLYCSPLQRARPGSLHGYDIVDHEAINPELGGEAGFDALATAALRRGMGLLLDVVPNHMAVLNADNAWWFDVLEHGPASSFARFFDIDWHPPNRLLDGKVLVPLLGDHYGLALERGELVLRFDAGDGRFAIDYYDHRLPIDPRESVTILRSALGQSVLTGAGDEARASLAELIESFERLPPRETPAVVEDADGGVQPTERAETAGRCRRELTRWVESSPEARLAIDAAVAALNADSAGARDALHALIERQAWRLAYWRVASDEINYRRFFDVNELAGLRVDDPRVFDATHALVIDLVASGRVQGLRIDHPDGLFDPGAYFIRLQAACASRRGAQAPRSAARTQWRPVYVVIEKIAAAHERLPGHWPIHGTTGYRFAALVNGLFVDRAARARIDRTWRAFTGERSSFDEIASEGRRIVMRSAFTPDLTTLAAELTRIAAADRRTRDYTFGTLRRALTDVAARMPVYRTYIAERVSPRDRRYVDWAIGAAIRDSRVADPAAFAFMRDVLVGRAAPGSPVAVQKRALAFARRFQQFTSPVMAKGVEDTALYRFNRLVSLNEVGSDPESFGLTVKAFHAANADRAANWPHALLALSTHDNKRSADVRARIDVISERPAPWRLLLRRWRLMNRARRAVARVGRNGGAQAPSANDEYLLYQVLLGTFRPAVDGAGDGLAAYTDRIDRYMLKAAREAKLHTSWVNPDADYERALANFVRELLAPGDSNLFVADLAAQVEPIAWFGALNSLAMTAIEYTAPGVPDLYQGNECFDFSLVDPDNRRPVDFAAHAAMLDRIERRVGEVGIEATAAELARDPRRDEAKLFVVWRLLHLRRAEPAVFRDGEYLPLETTGTAAGHLVAYARRHRSTVVVVLVARLCAKLLTDSGLLPEKDAWGDAGVALGSPGHPVGDAGFDEPVGAGNSEFVDWLSGRCVRVVDGRIAAAEAFTGFPAVVLYGPAAAA